MLYSFNENVFEYRGLKKEGHHFVNDGIDYYFGEDVIESMVNTEIKISKPVPLESFSDQIGIIDRYLKHGEGVCSITYNTGIIPKSDDEIKAERKALMNKHLNHVANARTAKKSMLKATEESLGAILKQPISLTKPNKMVTLIGKKITFHNSNGIYKFLNFADNQIYDVNLKGLVEFTAKGVRFYTNNF